MTTDKSKRRRLKRLLRAVAVILLVFLAISVATLAFTKMIYDSLFPRYEYNLCDSALIPEYSCVEMLYPRESIRFVSGDNNLSGYLYGNPDAKALVVLSPGLSAGADDYLGIIEYLADSGFAVLAYDTTGSFSSEGSSSVGFSQGVCDLDALLTYIENDKELKTLPVLLFGHSRGGYASVCMLSLGHRISGVVTVSGVNSPMEITVESSYRRVGALAYLGYPALYAYQAMLFGSDISTMTAAQSISDSDCPVLVVQGSDDAVTDPGGSSIYAHRDEIDNPNAEYILIDKENQNGHTSLLYSAQSALYRESVRREYDLLLTEHAEDSDKVRYYCDSVDPELATEPNAELMEKIATFFERCLATAD